MVFSGACVAPFHPRHAGNDCIVKLTIVLGILVFVVVLAAGWLWTPDKDRALLDKLGVAKASVVGHSIGGRIAWTASASSG